MSRDGNTGFSYEPYLVRASLEGARQGFRLGIILWLRWIVFVDAIVWRGDIMWDGYGPFLEKWSLGSS